MISKVTALIDEYSMIEEHDLVAAGVSGGADSLCLLFMLLEYRKKVPFDLIVVHVNHGIREDADRDAEFVKTVCEKENLPFYLVEEDIREKAKREHLSEEEAGRIVRYAAFEKALENFDEKRNRSGKIAVAHHAADSAETLLFNLFRGTGIYGLSGILPVSKNVIRPLLTCSREEIEEYLMEKGREWCMDSTNEEDTYSRNKIRHHILGYAKEHINEKATEHIAGTALQIAALRQYLEGEVEKVASKVAIIRENAIETNLEKLREYPYFLQEQYWLWALGYLSPGRKDITSKHVKALGELMEKQGSNKNLDLPAGLTAIKEYNVLRIGVDEKETSITDKNLENLEYLLEKEGNYHLSDGSILEVSYINLEQIEGIEENKYTKYFDYDKINSCLKVRFRQTGDYLCINDSNQKKTLKEYFIQEKIPASMRSKIPVIADQNHILWVMGYRISAYYKVTEETQKILKMTVRRDETCQKESAFY